MNDIETKMISTLQTFDFETLVSVFAPIRGEISIPKGTDHGCAANGTVLIQKLVQCEDPQIFGDPISKTTFEVGKIVTLNMCYL